MTKRILIIDDEAEIRRNLTFGLTQEGFSCTACPNGLSAIHELEKARAAGQSYELLITDIFMPDIDGLKILKVIKKEYPELPVLVITGFGDDALKAAALAEGNTGYLDKPFEMEELVEAINRLSPAAPDMPAIPKAALPAGGAQESASAYLTIRITDPARSREIFEQLSRLESVAVCDAVRGDLDIIILAQAASEDHIRTLFDRVRAVEGIAILSMSAVECPRLDREVRAFIDVYQQVVKAPAQAVARTESGTASYIIVDIDPAAIQQIFTTVFFIDEVIVCDVIDGGRKLVGMVTTAGAMGRTPRVIEKLTQIDGVLRVREAPIIRLAEE